jgi:hypothetical protein
VSRQKIRVEMREENVCDAKVMIRREREVLIDVALWIDDSGRAAGFIRHDVGRVRQAVEIELFENHEKVFGGLVMHRRAS